MTFNIGDKVQLKNGKRKMVVIGIVGSGQPLPGPIESLVALGSYPNGHVICQHEDVKCSIKTIILLEEALELS